MSSASSRGGSENSAAPTISPVDADQRSGVAGLRGLARRQGAVVAERAQVRVAADGDAAAADRSLDPPPRLLDCPAREVEPQAAVARLLDERAGERVDGDLVERGGETQALGLIEAVHRRDPLDARRAEGDRAGLVEHAPCAPRPSRSIAAAPLTTTPARAARETPQSSAIGAARISGHGVATTKTASARTGSPDTAQAAPATTIVSGRKNAA